MINYLTLLFCVELFDSSAYTHEAPTLEAHLEARTVRPTLRPKEGKVRSGEDSDGWQGKLCVKLAGW